MLLKTNALNYDNRNKTYQHIKISILYKVNLYLFNRLLIDINCIYEIFLRNSYTYIIDR